MSTQTPRTSRTAGATGTTRTARTARTVPSRLLRALCAAYTRWAETTSDRVLTASRSSRWGYLGMVATGQVSNEDRLPA